MKKRWFLSARLDLLPPELVGASNSGREMKLTEDLWGDVERKFHISSSFQNIRIGVRNFQMLSCPFTYPLGQEYQAPMQYLGGWAERVLITLLLDSQEKKKRSCDSYMQDGRKSPEVFKRNINFLLMNELKVKLTMNAHAARTMTDLAWGVTT